MDRVKLADRSFEELNKLRLSIENNPKNKLSSGSFYLYTPKTRQKLSDIAWAVTNKIMRERVEGY